MNEQHFVTACDRTDKPTLDVWLSPLTEGGAVWRAQNSLAPTYRQSNPMQRGGVLIETAWRAVSLSSRRCSSQLSTPIRRSRIILRHICTSSVKATNMYTAVERGQRNSLDYRVFFVGQNGNPVSPFHDIPLHANAEKTVFNMVVEIPRWSNAKMEISKEEKLNPIKQDVKKGKLRFVKNVFPHHGYIWNYGALPQTWEDPKVEFSETKTKGDNDPLDVCEIGQTIHPRGSVVQVKVLGTLCLIDEGETDWKIIAIDVNDPLAESLNDVDDVNKLMPGFLKASFEWFKYYKVPDGKPVNQFAFDGKCKDKAYALNVVQEANNQWQALVGKANESGVACENSNVAGSPYKIEPEDAKVILDTAPALTESADPLDSEVDKWHYVSM